MIGFHPTIEALGDVPFVPGSPGGEMKCPSCAQHTPDAWQPWVVFGGSGTRRVLTQSGRDIQTADGETVTTPDSDIAIDWMECANDRCHQIVIRAHESYRIPSQLEDATRTWLVYPRSSGRPIDSLVQGPVRSDYTEAAAILDLSPRMSAVMSRRILADLLKTYAGQEQYGLPDRIDGFIKDTHHPS